MKKVLLSIVLLSLSSVAMADLPDSCKTYFDQVDELIKKIPDDAATKAQVDMIKEQLEAGKKQLETMPAEQQEAGCKQGLDMLKQMAPMMAK